MSQAPPGERAARWAGGGGAVVLLAVYVATLAPSATLWDSGEFLAAIRSFGVPHPPGTPLFITIARAWSLLFAWLPFAAAVNAASAVATAGAIGLLALLVARWTGRPAAGVTGGLMAGGMAAVWQSATETEVYAYALLLVAATLLAADHARRDDSHRGELLVAFLFGLAVPLHLSALAAGPAVVLLSATRPGAAVDRRRMLQLGGAWLLAIGAGTVSWVPAGAGAVTLALSAFATTDRRPRWRLPAATALLVLAGASFVVVMLLRARYDPGVNQGNPATWEALVDVVARRQYDVPPLYPRRAPFWLQVGNVAQYADWQVASSLSDAPGPSPWRTPFTLVLIGAAIAGAVWHRRADRDTWRVVSLLFVCVTMGVVTVLNLRAGPSFGYGILPADAIREARERDYFFALAFAVWGVWGGCGLVAIADRLRGRGARGVYLLAMVPLVLNWRAADRRRLPEAALAESIGRAILAPLPPQSVVVLGGDNDSYPVWFVQQVQGFRRDVTPVTVPLLGAGWYRNELHRRHSLLDPLHADTWHGTHATLAALAAGAERNGRQLAAAVSVQPEERQALGWHWRFTGMAYLRNAGPLIADVVIDTAAVERSADLADSLRRWPDDADVRDPAGRYVQRLLSCPTIARAWIRSGHDTPPALLESTCNLR